MSLIIDALKRAQQLRLSGAEESPTLNYPYPKRKTGRRSKKQWIPVGAGLIGLCIVLLVLLRPASSPLATQTNRSRGEGAFCFCSGEDAFRASEGSGGCGKG
jgi:hypothetical protein